MKAIFRLIKYLYPPEKWRLPVVILLGIMTGFASFIFKISEAPSYLSDDSKTCINCHVMYSQYASWSHSSHANVTNCNDCHVPHNNFISKYYFKAKDGLRHATMFTFRMEPQVIQIKEAGQGVVQENCKRCHSDMVSMVNISEVNNINYNEGKGFRCFDCHTTTPHGEVNSLAAFPFALIQQQKTNTPQWLSDYLKQNK